ncbi:MAG: hypothetical protein KW793_01480 [Candidatus Doudnabacteria bacterium]|nr:hypothetical protein [Candidatus Doudnabacteria bacterium]
MRAQTKLLVVAYDALPEEVCWAHIGLCGLPFQNMQIDMMKVNPDNDVIEHCRDWYPDYIIDLTSDLHWSAKFLSDKNNVAEIKNLPVLTSFNPKQRVARWVVEEFQLQMANNGAGKFDESMFDLFWCYEPRPMN